MKNYELRALSRPQIIEYILQTPHIRARELRIRRADALQLYKPFLQTIYGTITFHQCRVFNEPPLINQPDNHETRSPLLLLCGQLQKTINPFQGTKYRFYPTTEPNDNQITLIISGKLHLEDYTTAIYDIVNDALDSLKISCRAESRAHVIRVSYERKNSTRASSKKRHCNVAGARDLFNNPREDDIFDRNGMLKKVTHIPSKTRARATTTSYDAGSFSSTDTDPDEVPPPPPPPPPANSESPAGELPDFTA